MCCFVREHVLSCELIHKVQTPSNFKLAKLCDELNLAFSNRQCMKIHKGIDCFQHPFSGLMHVQESAPLIMPWILRMKNENQIDVVTSILEFQTWFSPVVN